MTNGNLTARGPEGHSQEVAPRVFISYSHDSPEHQQQVHRLATFLRMRIGLDVHVDLWYDNVRRDWSLWAIDQLNEADFVLVIASPKFKQRADGTAPSHEGRGAQYEASIIRDKLTKDLKQATQRFLPVVLPGHSIDEIPTFLNAHSTTRYEIKEISDSGVADLIAAITGQGRHPMPERGVWVGGKNPVAKAEGPLTIAKDLPWPLSTAGVRAAPAVIDDIRYADSVILRPRAVDTPVTGFLDVDLGGRFQTMESVVCLLGDASGQFALFRVHLDNVPHLERKVWSGKPEHIEVDVAGALRLRLEMSRPWSSVANDLAERTTLGKPTRPPELVWGDPTLR